MRGLAGASIWLEAGCTAARVRFMRDTTMPFWLLYSTGLRMILLVVTEDWMV